MKGRKFKGLTSNILGRDEFNEKEFSPCHFNQETVMKLLKDTIDK